MEYLTKVLTKEFCNYKEAIDFVNTVKKGKPCNTEGESACKACLKGVCSSLDKYNPYDLFSLNKIEEEKFLLLYLET